MQKSTIPNSVAAGVKKRVDSFPVLDPIGLDPLLNKSHISDEDLLTLGLSRHRPSVSDDFDPLSQLDD